MDKKYSRETLCVQAGWTPKKGEPRVLPIYQSTTFKYDTSEQMARLFDLEDSGYFYTRLQNPTNDAVAAKIAALEGGVGAMLTSSGQAANFYAIFNICQAGDHFVCSSTIYGGTFNLFGVTLKKLGIECTFIDANASEEEIDQAFRPNTKALFGETISNPSIDVLDIEKFARIAHKHGVPLIVDNTFATPYNTTPLDLGVDAVIHSLTKYIGGHSDVVGGAVVLNDMEIRDEVAFLQNAAGAVPSPFDSWLDIRGLKTLDLRVKQHSRNAMKVAQWLETRPEVERVWYPGLESHPGHEIAARQMHGGFGGMISVQIAAGFEAAKKFAGATEVFTLAESLGGVESLIEHPGAMTHASVAGTTLEVPANLVRLSVGLEDADDLIADLEQAFRQI